MSTSKKSDKFLKEFEEEITESLSELSEDYIYNSAIAVRDSVYSEMTDFFRFVGSIILDGRLNSSPFKGIRWVPLARGTKVKKWEKNVKRRSSSPPSRLPNKFYFMQGDLQRALFDSVLSESAFKLYLGLRLIIESKNGGTNTISLHQKENQIRYSIRRILSKKIPVGFYFKISPVFSVKDWMEVVGLLSDKKACFKFFAGGKRNLPNEDSRPLLRPAMSLFLKTRVAKAMNGVL